ncbi:MAG: ATP-binding protein, partial [Gemmatimonadota bacterium]|nr:ATP-binding protein [Gemmatimonadota bacterium]
MSPGASPMPPRSLGWRVAFWLLALHGVAFSVSEFYARYAEKARWLRLYDAGAFLPLQLASALALWHAARRPGLPESTARALRYIAAAFGVLSVASLYWFTRELLGNPLQYISWADLLYLPFYPLLIVGFWAFPVMERAPDWRRDTLGRVVLVIVFGSLIAYAAYVDAQSRVLTSGLRAMTVATSGAQLATLMLINRVMERARRVPSGRAVLLLASALALSVVADLTFQVVFATGYAGRNWSVPTSIATNLLVVLAAIRFAEDPLPGTTAAKSPPIPFSPLPILAVTALGLMLVWMAGRDGATGIGPLLVGLVVVNAILVVREMFASRASAEELRSSAERDATRRVETLVRHASDAILLLDDAGTLLFASAPADRLFGAPVGALEGAKLEPVLADSNRQEWRDFLDDVLTAGGRPVTFTCRLVRGTGDERMIECVGLDLRREPTVRGIVVHARDITDRALLEERLRQSQKLEVAGRLAGGVAHDFNNVLTAVIAGTELAEMSLEPDHPAMQDLVGVQEAAQRGAALTRRLLAFVRQEPVPAQSVDLRAMLRGLALLLQRLAGEAHLVVVHADEALGAVRVDQTELEHIIFNLVANARDAMPSGGRIEVRADLVDVVEPPADAVIPPPPGRHACISVADQGLGMSDEVRQRMFDPFFTQKTGGRGTGLGLIGVRPLVEGAGGGVTVRSEAGYGTRVALYLPVEVAAATPPPRRDSPIRTPVFGTSAVARTRVL